MRAAKGTQLQFYSLSVGDSQAIQTPTNPHYLCVLAGDALDPIKYRS